MTILHQLLRDRLFGLVAVLLLAVGFTGGVGAASQLGRTFPGFLVLGNQVVASIGLSIWPATAGGEIFQRPVTALDGEPLGSALELRDRVAALPPGTAVTYTLGHGERAEARVVQTRTFGARDFTLLYGLYLLNGIVLGAAALVCIARRRRTPGALAAAPLMLFGALWVLSALDLYGPYRLFRLHAWVEAMLFPAALHMALCYPVPLELVKRFRGLVPALYAAGAVLGAAIQWSLFDGSAYSPLHLIAVSAFGVALAGVIVSEVDRLRRPLDSDPRARLQAVLVGAGLALTLPIVVTAMESFTGGRSPQNAAALTAFLFPVAVAYAVTREVEPAASAQQASR